MSAKNKPTAQIKREIVEILEEDRGSATNAEHSSDEVGFGASQIKLRDRYSGGDVWLTIRDGIVVGVMGSDPSRYMGMPLDEARHHARHGGSRGARSRALAMSPALIAEKYKPFAFRSTWRWWIHLPGSTRSIGEGSTEATAWQAAASFLSTQASRTP